MAAIFKVTPKVGPLRDIDFKEPTTKTENLYFKSVNQTVDQYGKALQQVKNQDLQAPDINLDTGKPTKRGEYPLADASYRELLDQLAADHFANMDDALRDNILKFYDGLGFPPPGTRIDKCVVQRWSKTWIEVTQLRSFELLDVVSPPGAGNEAQSLPPSLNPGSSSCAQ